MVLVYARVADEIGRVLAAASRVNACLYSPETGAICHGLAASLEAARGQVSVQSSMSHLGHEWLVRPHGFTECQGVHPSGRR